MVAYTHRYLSTTMKWCDRIYSGEGATYDPERVQDGDEAPKYGEGTDAVYADG